jgi:hypothetical protein
MRNCNVQLWQNDLQTVFMKVSTVLYNRKSSLSMCCRELMNCMKYLVESAADSLMDETNATISGLDLGSSSGASSL